MLKQHVIYKSNQPFLHFFDNDAFFAEIPAELSKLEHKVAEPIPAIQADIQYAVNKLETLSTGTESDKAKIAALKDYLH